MPWVPTVTFIVNGEPVDAATTNGPIADLTTRTDFLKAALDSIEAGTQLLLRSQPVEAGLVEGEAVYLDSAANTFKKALASVDPTNLNQADDTTFWQGLILTVSGTTADIVIGGNMILSPVTWAPAFEDGVFSEGHIYLSDVTPGKITTSPGSLGVYLGDMRSTGEMLVRLASPGAFTDHVHYQRTVLGKPAGSVIDPAYGDPHVVNTPDSGQQGWLPATPAYFPGFVVGVQIPVNAKFGYNIQHASESALREVFPVLPENNAQFSQGGSILTSDKVITNNYGIWWVDDSYGNAPWPVDYDATSIATDILLWTTRIVASATILDLVLTAIENSIAAGDLDSILTRTVNTSDTFGITVTGTEGDAINGFSGEVDVVNNGVTGYRSGRGLLSSGVSGAATTGWKGLVDTEFDADLTCEHLWTELSVVGDKLLSVSTNGAPAGTLVGIRGHRLGPVDGSDYIDFVIDAGPDLESGETYSVVLSLRCAVDVPAGPVSTGDIDIQYYRFANNNSLTDTNLVATTTVQLNEGTPGRLQLVSAGTVVNANIAQNEIMIVRIKPTTAGSPITPDSVRIMSVSYGLDKL